MDIFDKLISSKSLEKIILSSILFIVGAGILIFKSESFYEFLQQNPWKKSKAYLLEVGIRTHIGAHYKGASALIYELTVSYSLTVKDKVYKGNRIGNGHTSQYSKEVKSLLVPFVAEAQKFDFDNVENVSWEVPRVPITVRYDPKDPSQSEMMLANPIELKLVPPWILNLIVFILFAFGFIILFLIWLDKHKKKWVKSEIILLNRTTIKSYSAEDQQRLKESIALLQTEISLIMTPTTISKQKGLYLFAAQIAELSEATRNGSLVPGKFANHGLGQGDNKVFGEGDLSAKANAVQKIIDELAKKYP